MPKENVLQSLEASIRRNAPLFAREVAETLHASCVDGLVSSDLRYCAMLQTLALVGTQSEREYMIAGAVNIHVVRYFPLTEKGRKVYDQVQALYRQQEEKTA